MTLLVLGKDGTTRTFGGPVHPPSDVLIADSALCTMQLVAKDAGGKIVDACTAVAISAGDDRFFAFTARHAVHAIRTAASVGASYAIERYSHELVDPEPVDMLSEVGLPAVAPELDAALFEMFPMNDTARDRLRRRALPLDRLLIPTFKPGDDLTAPIAFCGFPKSLASIDLDLFPSMAQLHFVGLAARATVRRVVESTTPGAEHMAAVEADDTVAEDNEPIETPTPFNGCSGAGYFLGAMRKSSGGYYSGLAGIHSRTIEAFHANGSVTRVLVGPSAAVYVTMLSVAPSGLLPRIQKIWPTFKPLDTPVIPWREDEE